MVDNSSKSAVVEIAKHIKREFGHQVALSYLLDDDTNNASEIMKAYEHMNLTGSESSVEMFIELNKNQRNNIKASYEHTGKLFSIFC